MIMGSRVEIEELQVVPMSAVYLDCFIEKTTLFSDLVNICYSRLLTSDLLFVAAKTRSIANFKLKRLILSQSFGGKLLI